MNMRMVCSIARQLENELARINGINSHFVSFETCIRKKADGLNACADLCVWSMSRDTIRNLLDAIVAEL